MSAVAQVTVIENIASLLCLDTENANQMASELVVKHYPNEVKYFQACSLFVGKRPILEELLEHQANKSPVKMEILQAFRLVRS